MGMNKKRLSTYLVGILLVVFLSMNISSAQISFNNSGKVEFDVLDKLNKESEVKVIVEINSEDSNLIDFILSNLPKSEFKLKRKLLGNDAFVGNITKDGLEKLISNLDVKMIYLSRVAHIHLTESLPLINATKVWSEGYTGKDQTVCVIDSGINYSHSDLGGCLGSGCKVLDGYDFVNSDSDPMDDNGHGTHVAGIVAAKGAINGTAPDAKLIAMKACNIDGGCSDEDIRDSIEWCINNKTIYNISIISISIGGNESYTEANCPVSLRTQINDAYAANISIFISSGNNNHTDGISWPACRGNATSVGAVYDDNVGFRQWCTQRDNLGNCIENCIDFTTAADQMACFTNRGSNLDLLAPGSIITSLASGGPSDCADGTCSGTSQAAPHVAGAAALLLERDPTLTPDKIREVLQNNGTDIWDPESQRSYPRIDVLAAINSLCTCTDWTGHSCS